MCPNSDNIRIHFFFSLSATVCKLKLQKKKWFCHKFPTQKRNNLIIDMESTKVWRHGEIIWPTPLRTSSYKCISHCLQFQFQLLKKINKLFCQLNYFKIVSLCMLLFRDIYLLLNLFLSPELDNSRIFLVFIYSYYLFIILKTIWLVKYHFVFFFSASEIDMIKLDYVIKIILIISYNEWLSCFKWQVLTLFPTVFKINV